MIQVYITSASRSYQLADHYRSRGAHVALGGLHVTSLPDGAAAHADTVFWARVKTPGPPSSPTSAPDARPRYRSTIRTLAVLPIRRDLIKRHLYLVPNSIVVSRGCPHACDFCYKEAFFEGGRGFYTQAVDDARGDRAPAGPSPLLPRRPPLRQRAVRGSAVRRHAGMNRVWQAAGTVASVLRPGLLERARGGPPQPLRGLRDAQRGEPAGAGKLQNLHRDYGATIRRLQEHGVMVNGSFVFGMDGDDTSVFDRTVEWAVEQGIETATFHILTPYPGTALYDRMRREDRLLHRDWDLYDTRHTVFRPARLTPQLEEGYWRAYESFYRWSAIPCAAAKPSWPRPAAARRVRRRMEEDGAALGPRYPRETRVPCCRSWRRCLIRTDRTPATAPKPAGGTGGPQPPTPCRPGGQIEQLEVSCPSKNRQGISSHRGQHV